MAILRERIVSHVNPSRRDRAIAVLVTATLLSGLITILASSRSLAVDDAPTRRGFRPQAVQEPFRFESSPVPIDQVTRVNWYGNTEFAFDNWPDYYSQLQRFHNGVDFLLPIGNPITSAVNRTGRVVSRNNSPYDFQAGPGNVVVDYGPFLVLYGHTMEDPAPGMTVPGLDDPVNPGDIVAYSGQDVGLTPHLHLEVMLKVDPPPVCSGRPGCVRTNPVPFFSEAFHDAITAGPRGDLAPDEFHKWPNCDRWLHEYDQPDITPADPPYTGCADWPPKRSVDVVLVIDSSASMGTNDPQDERLDAAKAFLTASLAKDRVAVVDFSTTARPASPLRDLPSGRQALIDAIDSIPSDGASTNIQAGVTLACNELVSNGQATRRGVILLTDGIHNEGPFEDAQQCFVDRSWPVFSLGFGSADLDFLKDVSDPTGGEAKMIDNVSNLVCEFQLVRAKISGGAPPDCESLHLNPLQKLFFEVRVRAGQAVATFSNAWSGSDIVMTLTSPSGRRIGRTTTAADVVHDKGAAFEVYSIVSPEAGMWRVRLFAKDVPPSGEDTVFAFSTIEAPPRTKVVDDRSHGFRNVGSAWHVQKAGHRKRSYWTTVRRSGKRHTAVWKAALDAPGAYAVSVEIPMQSATTRTATYRVFTADGVRTREVDQSTVRGRRVVVDATDGGSVASGLSVRTGDRLRIRAGGDWCMGAGECGGPDGIRSANPDEPDLRDPTAEIGTLLARVGPGPWLPVGDDRTFTAQHDGQVRVVFNDRECCYGDNSGSIDATVSVESFSLGTHLFGNAGRVKLTDRTGERTGSRRLVVDVARFVPVAFPAPQAASVRSSAKTADRRRPQTIDFDSIPAGGLDGSSITLTATASSGLPVAFHARGECAVDGDRLTLVDVGVCAVIASQGGDERWLPADEVERTIEIAAATRDSAPEPEPSFSPAPTFESKPSTEPSEKPEPSLEPSLAPEASIVPEPESEPSLAPSPTNVPPIADAGGPYEVDEGGTVELDGSASSDPDGGIVAWAWSREKRLDDPTRRRPTFDGVDDGTLDVELTVTDDQGATDAEVTEVRVRNVDPRVDDLGPFEIVAGEPLAIEVAIRDPGRQDTHDVRIEWGDGSSDESHVEQGPATGSHTYAEPGEYELTVIAVDDDGGRDQRSTTVRVMKPGENEEPRPAAEPAVEGEPSPGP
jgi:murein DD-endopeptidase MepM/ murein hydrolase activator NlpD